MCNSDISYTATQGTFWSFILWWKKGMRKEANFETKILLTSLSGYICFHWCVEFGGALESEGITDFPV